MTTLVDSEDHADAVLMGFVGSTHRTCDRVALVREHGGFSVIGGRLTVEFDEVQAEYIARAILKALGK